MQWTAGVFAEGGVLLNSVPSTLAVRLFSTGNLPQSFTVPLLEKSSRTAVAVIRSLNAAVGALKFIPKINTRYSVVIKDNAGTVQETDVPLSSDTGTSLSFIASDDKIESTIHASPML